MTDLKQTRARLRDLLEKATPGEWESRSSVRFNGSVSVWIDDQGGDDIIQGWGVSSKKAIEVGKWKSNADLIAAMRNALPAMLDRLDELEPLVNASEAMHDHLLNNPGPWDIPDEIYVPFDEALKGSKP